MYINACGNHDAFARGDFTECNETGNLDRITIGRNERKALEEEGSQSFITYKILAIQRDLALAC
jgi:hypothetical protein